MSLLDDVSIVVTPNGYKAGELYAVIPVPTEGSEILSQPVDLVTDFLTNSGGVIVDADTFTTSGGSLDGLRKLNFLTVDTRYKLTIEGDTTSSGFTIGSYGGNGNEYGSGFGTFYFTALHSGVWIRQQTAGTTNITSFSIKEYTAADMDVTRATAATRVDENGLVNYAEIIGGEEIVDGDFPSGTTAWSFGGGWSLGVDSAEATSGSSGKLSQTNTLNGKYAQVTLTVSNYGGAGLILVDFGSLSSSYITSDGTHTLYGTYDQDVFEIYMSSTFSGNVTNVSVKQVDRDNVPRIDYTGGGCPHILAEPQRTNFVVTSASGTYGSPPASEILAIAPDGENTAIKPVPSTSSNRYQETIAGGTYSSGDEVTYSWYRKRFSTPVVDSYVGDLFINFIVNCTQVGVTTEIISDVNGFNRVSATFSITDGSIDSILRFYFGSIIGTGNSSVAYWGHQLEQGSYATSYIPTSGGTVTRNQDIFTRDGIGSLINSTEGVLFVEMARQEGDTSAGLITLNDGTNSQTVSLYYFSTGTIYFDILSGSPNVSQGVSGIDTYSFNKIAIKYKSGDIAFWINGVEVYTSASAISLTGLNTLSFSQGNDAYPFNGKVKQLQVYDTALSPTQLAALTS
jgi:hypothetical protein